MATYQLSILGANTVPDDSGNVYLEPYSVKATNGLWEYLVMVFADTATRIGLRGAFVVPQNYSSGATIKIIWCAPVDTLGDVEWDFDYRCIGGDDTESLDQNSAQETVNQNDTCGSAINERVVASLSLTAGNFAAGDICQFELFRDGTDGGDTMSDDAIVHAVLFEYSD